MDGYNYYDLLVKMGVIGLCVTMAGWALKNYIALRTKPAVKIDPKQVFVTVGLMEGHCKDKREEYEKMQAQNLSHAVELIRQNLKAGDKKFTEFGTKLETITTTITDMGKTITMLDTKLDNEIKANKKGDKG